VEQNIPITKNSFTHIAVTFIVAITAFLSCGNEDGGDRDYRQDMRDFVQHISSYAKNQQSEFLVITQNGQELLTDDGEATGTLATLYCAALDGVGQEDVFYGYDSDNTPTPGVERTYLTGFLDRAENAGLEVLVTDYCWTHEYVDTSYEQSQNRNYISFAADHRELDNIPSYPDEPYNINDSDATALDRARNFLYLIDPSAFAAKTEFLDALRGTDYDLLLIDLFYGGIALNVSEVTSLKNKYSGGTRLVVCYMSIGEAESYRYYWQQDWLSDPPVWLEAENPDWPGNFKVQYWQEEWQGIICGNDSSYVKRIIDAGFDGVYLDIIDAFEYFESQ
jgi:cysteinyl-tRNA synthetase